MNRLELARASYARLAPRGGEDLDQGRWATVERWLGEEVGPVADDLAACPRFRRLARWPVEQLAVGAAGPERRLLEQADAALVGCAGALAAWAGRPEVRAELGRLERPGGRAGRGASWESDRSVAEWAAGRPWRDLVAVEDYFHPCRGLNLAHPGGPVREDLDAFDPLARPDLGEPGDQVSRLLLARLGFWLGPLRRLWGLCLSGFTGRTGDAARELAQLRPS